MAAVSAALGAPPEDNVFASHLMVDQDVIVSARITGIVESITVDRGSAVTQGQTLATLDPRALDADVREAKEDMGSFIGSMVALGWPVERMISSFLSR